MKVLLINPPAENTILGNNPAIIDEERGCNPPLGLLYIAAYLQKHSPHEVEVIDSQVEELSYPQLYEKIKECGPDIAGITAMSFTMVDVLETARLLRDACPGIPVVLGGVHPYIYPGETMGFEEVDYLVLGEGESAFTELVNNIGRPEKLRGVKGLVFRDGSEIINTGPAPPVEDLDELPFPARLLTDYTKYNSLIARRSPITTMITSRGCPYRCSFCSRPHIGKKFRARSASNIVDEMEQCTELGIREFLVYDDTFTVDRRRVVEVCEEILRRNLDIGWDIRARVDLVDMELLEKLAMARCERIHFGVEAGTDKILKVLRKGITVEDARNAFRWARKAGISTLAYFMIGSPGETREDILQTICLAKELNPDFVHITMTTPFPSTELYREGLEKGIWKEDFWKSFAINPVKGFRPFHCEQQLCEEELEELLEYAYKSFYGRPLYVVKQMTKIRSFRELRRKLKAGLKILFPYRFTVDP